MTVHKSQGLSWDELLRKMKQPIMLHEPMPTYRIDGTSIIEGITKLMAADRVITITRVEKDDCDE